jgi:hypothetical protein
MTQIYADQQNEALREAPSLITAQARYMIPDSSAPICVIRG